MLSREEVINFLKDLHPFSQLNLQQINELVSDAVIQSFKRGSRVEIDRNYVLIIYSGEVRIGMDYYDSGDIINPERTYEKSLEVINDCTIIKLPTNLLSRYYDLKEFPTYFTERIEKISLEIPVKFLIKRRPVTVYENVKIRDAAKIMLEHGVSSVIIIDKYGKPVGILTDTDLRKVIANEVDINNPVSSVMSKELIVASADETALNVLLKMIKHRIKHIVIQNYEIEGVLAIRDLVEIISRIPIYTIRDLAKARSKDHDYIIITPDSSKEVKEIADYLKEELHNFTYGRLDSVEHISTLSLKDLNTRLRRGDETSRLLISLLADSRVIYGSVEIYSKVRNFIEDIAVKDNVIYQLLIEDVLKYKPSLDVFDKIVSNEIDIKYQGLLPISLGVQMLALTHKISQTNTIDRLENLEKLGVISSDLRNDLEIAYTYIHYLKIKIEALKSKDEEVDTKLSLDMLSELELKYLKDSLRVIKRFRKFLEQQLSKYLVL
ncbi:MAG: hypothetical protein B6V02_03945 [Thermoprotei archaeon ex4572_64]|nr:MAG: hypothetical protein B6V02_03945 [Thermoprotei archaeon ex4572_64]